MVGIYFSGIGNSKTYGFCQNRYFLTCEENKYIKKQYSPDFPVFFNKNLPAAKMNECLGSSFHDTSSNF